MMHRATLVTPRFVVRYLERALEWRYVSTPYYDETIRKYIHQPAGPRDIIIHDMSYPLYRLIHSQVAILRAWRYVVVTTPLLTVRGCWILDMASGHLREDEMPPLVANPNAPWYLQGVRCAYGPPPEAMPALLQMAHADTWDPPGNTWFQWRGFHE